MQSSGVAVKGVAFRSIEACFVELKGPEALEKARSLMSCELYEGYKYRTILAASWYPIAWYKETLQCFREATGEGVELPRNIGRLAARRDMNGVHRRIIAMVVSPTVLLRMSQRVFSTYYNVGRFEVVDSRPGFVEARCSDCTGWDRNMWSELLGSSESLLEIAGAKSVRLHVLNGGGDHDSMIQMVARWT